jgi:hypothetical protein
MSNKNAKFCPIDYFLLHNNKVSNVINLFVRKKDMLQLELLANELLFYIFEFFDTDHLARAFFSLNCRLNHLLYYQFRVHQLCFQSIMKNDFDIICQEYLPVVIDQISSLRLSNGKTSNLSELLSRGFTLDKFLYLKSLSLYGIYSNDTMNQIIIQCRCLSHLHHLNRVQR